MEAGNRREAKDRVITSSRSTMRILFRTAARVTALLSLSSWCAIAQDGQAQIEVNFSERLGPMRIGQMALGQGGLSDQPMWGNRVPEIRALRPALIRLFVQEYFDLLPEKERYHFETLDRSVETILQTGAKPLMCICFKPPVLFPQINQDIVEPNDYAVWEELIFNLVRHYQELKAQISYWEIANEPDIGEDGGCPYRFKPASYARYYARTVAAIRRADPEARVGGPALADCRSAILPELLHFCQTNGAPLDFISWHIYNSEPSAIRRTIEYISGLIKTHPGIKPETFLDEWNMDLMTPPLVPGFQPCFVAETIWQMKDAGLDYSCYYHIRDWYVAPDRFSRFMSPKGTRFMARWWNRMPQFDGLFDYQDTVRPAYFVFKLLSRLAGEKLKLSSSHSAVHGFAAHDEQLHMYNLVLWNFSPDPIKAEVSLQGLPRDMRMRHLTLDATTSSYEENTRLRPEPFTNVSKGEQRLSLSLEPYAVDYWSFE